MLPVRLLQTDADLEVPAGQLRRLVATGRPVPVRSKTVTFHTDRGAAACGLVLFFGTLRPCIRGPCVLLSGRASSHARA
jgi:hypothetical protein